MDRRQFLRHAGLGACALGCGGYLPDGGVLEVSSLQSRAADLPLNRLLWDAVDRFIETHPDLTVTPASGGGGGYQELMIRVMEGHPPDIMSFATAETGLTYAYVEQGHVLDLTQDLRRPAHDTPGATWLDTISPLYHDTLTYEGRFYAIPQNVVSLQLYCNADLYEQAGATLEPRTWSAFVDNCERLRSLGVSPITQDGIHWYTSWWFDHLAQRILGPEVVRRAFRDPARSAPWTQSGFAHAAALVRDLLDRRYFVDGFSGLNHIESELLFWQGRAATVFVGTWFTSGRHEVMGDDFRLHAYRFPAVEGGRGDPRDLIGTVNTLSVPARARHPAAAIDFLRLVNSRWFQQRLVDEVRMVSPLIGMPLPAVQQGLERIMTGTRRFHPFSFGLEGAHPFLYRQYWSEWNRFMVAGEIGVDELLRNLESLFVEYYRIAA